MRRSPLPHPLRVLRAAEVILVVGFAQPALLSGALAGRLARRRGTILLAPAIPVIGHKQQLTMQAFATARLGLHGNRNASHKTPAGRPQARRKSGREENGKRREEEFWENLGKKTEREENNNFKPADSPHFQTAADKLSNYPGTVPNLDRNGCPNSSESAPVAKLL